MIGRVAPDSAPATIPQPRISRPTGVLRIHRILVPIDFSPGSQRALDYAAEFAARVNARITLLHVVEPLGSPDLEYFPLLLEPEKLVLRARQQLMAMPRHRKLEAELFARPVVRMGIAFYEITETARKHEVDLVILSAHEFSGLQHVWLGSTAEQVVRHAGCPVLVLGKTNQNRALRATPQADATPAEAFGIRRILAPLDFSDPSREALRYAGRCAIEFGASVHLLYVADSFRKLRHVEPAAAAGYLPSELQEALKKRLATFANDEIPEVVTVHHEVRIGKAAPEIVSVADDMGADLLVIATHGRTGLKHVMLGSVAERVIREASCPVLVVRQEHRP